MSHANKSGKVLLFSGVPVLSEHNRNGCRTRAFSVSGHPLLCEKMSLIITGCVRAAFTAPLTGFRERDLNSQLGIFNIHLESKGFGVCFLIPTEENSDMWLLLGDNGEVYWHKTLWLTSESLCRFAGLVVEQWESFRQWDKHIMEIDGQGGCQDPFFL